MNVFRMSDPDTGCTGQVVRFRMYDFGFRMFDSAQVPVDDA
jgi:hypothetical protein